MTIKRDVRLSLSSIRFPVTVITLHCPYCIVCYGSADPKLGLGSHGRQQEPHRQAGHAYTRALVGAEPPPAAVGSARLSLGQGIEAMLSRWECRQWDISKAI